MLTAKSSEVKNDSNIRPILEAVDKLRRLNISQEGIPLPTVLLVGDKSAGKTSVLESLAGIRLPRCTRVPLIMRLQHHPEPGPEFMLEYQKKTFKIKDENQISEDIDKATVEIVGNSKCISKVPLTLIVKMKGVPNLTMVDLPGIARVPVGDQPQDIHQQISGIIMEYIKPKESIILNVLSAAASFPTCESICMSQRVDNTGQRTLAVVTNCDDFPNRLLEKVNANDVNIGLGYICVRNWINDETCEEARIEEANLFATHPLLSKIDKSMVGIPVLADRLVDIQSKIISKFSSDIVEKINERLNIPKAMVEFMQIVQSCKETLKKILIRREFDEYKNGKQMHCNARLSEMLDELSKELETSVKFSENFLVEEMQLLEKADGMWLLFVPDHVFPCLLKRKLENVSEKPVSFVNKVFGYLETVCARVLVDRCGNYPQLLPYMRKATQCVMMKMKAEFAERAAEMIKMEKITDYTCDPDFYVSYNKLMGYRDKFVKSISNIFPRLDVEGYGTIDVGHLRNVPEHTRDQAYDLKMKMTAYWKIVVKRMVDLLALQMHYFMQKVVNGVMEINGGDCWMNCHS